MASCTCRVGEDCKCSVLADLQVENDRVRTDLANYKAECKRLNREIGSLLMSMEYRREQFDEMKADNKRMRKLIEAQEEKDSEA